MKYYPKIKGDRIFLSPISMLDIETYTKWINDARVTDSLGVSWLLYTIDRERDFLEGISKNDYHFAIVNNENDFLLGNVSLFNFHQINRTAEFGIFIGESALRKRGYGTEAGKLMIDYGFNTLNLNNIMLRVFAFNEAAIKCYEKIGFKKMGVRRNAYYVNGKYHDEVYMDIIK